jgi:ATP-dependent Clp protease ATP-binding subunit ClpA
VEKTALTKFTEFFSPEFINRLNKMVVFHPLGEDGLGKVLDIKLAAANKEYESRFGAHLSLSEASRSHLVAAAMKEPHLGARPLIRAFENNVQSMFGRYAGNESIPEGTHVRVYRSEEVSPQALTASGGEYVFAAKYGESYRKQVTPAAIAAVQFKEIDADTEDEPRSESDEDGE